MDQSGEESKYRKDTATTQAMNRDDEIWSGWKSLARNRTESDIDRFLTEISRLPDQTRFEVMDTSNRSHS